MSDNEHELVRQIKERAYFLWENAGRPQISPDEFWHRAELEEMGERSVPEFITIAESLCPAEYGISLAQLFTEMDTPLRIKIAIAARRSLLMRAEAGVIRHGISFPIHYRLSRSSWEGSISVRGQDTDRWRLHSAPDPTVAFPTHPKSDLPSSAGFPLPPLLHVIIRFIALTILDLF
jgi:hypothetical protein